MIFGIIVGILLWYLIGLRGFYYWWTYEWGEIGDEFPMMLFAGILGPLAWVVGYFIHGGNKDRYKGYQ